MTQRTENRIWRGLFLAAIVGVGIAAGTTERGPSFVAGYDTVPSFYLDDEGNIWSAGTPQEQLKLTRWPRTKKIGG